MNKLFALFAIVFCLIPLQAGAVINQCHKSACPPIKRSSDVVKQTPAPKPFPKASPSKPSPKVSPSNKRG
jgi:hypothetical protein